LLHVAHAMKKCMQFEKSKEIIVVLKKKNLLEYYLLNFYNNSSHFAVNFILYARRIKLTVIKKVHQIRATTFLNRLAIQSQQDFVQK
jgi:hypothetical protein